jgi:DNA-binding XRE family transcriptional regulator
MVRGNMGARRVGCNPQGTWRVQNWPVLINSSIVGPNRTRPIPPPCAFGHLLMTYSIHNVIKTIMVSKSLTTSQMAEVAGCSKRSIITICRGKVERFITVTWDWSKYNPYFLHSYEPDLTIRLNRILIISLVRYCSAVHYRYASFACSFSETIYTFESS